MMRHRGTLPLLATFSLLALAPASVRAQQPAATPAPAPFPTPRACTRCDELDSLRALANAQRMKAEQAYDAAMHAYEMASESADSATRAAYERARSDYDQALRDYRRTQNKLMTVSIQRMQTQAESMARTMYQWPTGWLGVTFSGSYQIISENGQSVMRFKDYPVIEAVEPESPAEKGGVESGDIWVAVDGKDMMSGAPSFKELLQPGNKLTCKFKRGHSMVERVVVVEKRPQQHWPPTPGLAPRAPEAPRAPDAPEPPQPPEGSWRAPMPPGAVIDADAPNGGVTIRMYDNTTFAGAQLQSFTELKTYFGVDSGVLVLRVLPGTPAARAGLRGGDVITKAGGKTITTPAQFGRALDRAKDGTLAVEIVRQRKAQSLTLSW